MQITTWNVNSIRTRLDHVVQWLEAHPVDVLCVQETKVADSEFPRSAFEAIGYTPYIYGQKSYNGVALLSRVPLEAVQTGFAAVLGNQVSEFDEQKRVISAILNDVRIVNLYVPNGSAIGSDKYDYKLRWFAVLQQYLQTLLMETPNVLVCGDFNVAPDNRDIHDPTGREKQVMATDAERSALQTAVFAQGFTDGFRKFNSETGQFTWWDYRAAAFRRNLGWRIDHHYLSANLVDRAQSCTIDIEPRKLEKPSDHVPVTIEL